MSNKKNDEIAEQRKEEIEQKMFIIEEKAVKDQTVSGYGLKKVMRMYDELEMLNRGVFNN